MKVERYETDRNVGDRVEVKRERKEASVRSGKNKDARMIEVSKTSRFKNRVLSQFMTCNHM